MRLIIRLLDQVLASIVSLAMWSADNIKQVYGQLHDIFRQLKRFDDIQEELNDLEQELESQTAKLEEISERVNALDLKVDSLSEKIDEFGSKLDAIIELLTPPKAVGFKITLSRNGEDMAKKALDAGIDFQVFENGQATATLTPVDDKGVATDLPEGITLNWTCTEPSVVVSPSADGTTALLTAGDQAVDNATVTATGTLPDGTTISGTSDNFDVVPQPPGAAVAFKIALA